MKMGLGFLYLFIYVGTTVLLMKITQKVSNIKIQIPNDNTAEIDKALSDEKSSKLRNAYISVFKTLDIRTAISYMTDLFTNETSLKIKALNRLGIRKEVVFIPNERNENEATAVINYGQYSVSDDYQNGSFKEQVIDNTTDRVLIENDYPKASFHMCLIRNPDAKKIKEFYCEGCGTPIQLEGEAYVCKNCGAKYSSESFDWLISKAGASNEGIIQNVKTKDGKYKTFVNLFAYFLMAMIPLSFFSNKITIIKPLAIFSVISVVLMYAMSIFIIIKGHTPYKKIIEFDPYATPQRVADRAGYLLGLLYGSFQNEPTKIKPFMNSNCYSKWLQEYENIKQLQPYNSQIFDWDANVQAFNIKKFWTDKKMQYVTVNVTIRYLFLTENREAKSALAMHEFTMCKNKSLKYKHAYDVDTHFCNGCGMSIDMTADGKCKFCGTTYDIADFDWKIHSFSEPMEMAMKTIKKVLEIFHIKEENLPWYKTILEKSVKEFEEETPLPPQMYSDLMKTKKAAYDIYMSRQNR